MNVSFFHPSRGILEHGLSLVCVSIYIVYRYVYIFAHYWKLKNSIDEIIQSHHQYDTTHPILVGTWYGTVCTCTLLTERVNEWGAHHTIVCMYDGNRQKGQRTVSTTS